METRLFVAAGQQLTGDLCKLWNLPVLTTARDELLHS